MALEKEDLISAFKEFSKTVLPQLVEEMKVVRPATLNIDEAAIYLGVHRDTVRKLIREKELPHVRIAGRILLRPKTLDEYMEAQEHQNLRIEENVG